MAKRYTEELAAWVAGRARQRRQQDAAAVAFLAVRAEVAAAIEAGYALSTIWAHLRETGKLECGYETFRKHVRRFGTAASAPGEQLQAPERASLPPRTQATKPPAIGGFTFDATPKKEDLI